MIVNGNNVRINDIKLLYVQSDAIKFKFIHHVGYRTLTIQIDDSTQF